MRIGYLSDKNEEEGDKESDDEFDAASSAQAVAALYHEQTCKCNHQQTDCKDIGKPCPPFGWIIMKPVERREYRSLSYAFIQSLSVVHVNLKRRASFVEHLERIISY